MSDISPVLADPVKRLMELDPASVMALGDIACERLRQIESEGFGPKDDDDYPPGELSLAAASYAQANSRRTSEAMPDTWPWPREWWKPTSPVRNRIKAGALLVSEMARHYRNSQK